MKKNVSKSQLILGTLLAIFLFSIIIDWTYLRLYESNYCYFRINLWVTCYCENNINCLIWYSFHEFLVYTAIIVSVFLIIAALIYNIKKKKSKKNDRTQTIPEARVEKVCFIADIF